MNLLRVPVFAGDGGSGPSPVRPDSILTTAFGFGMDSRLELLPGGFLSVGMVKPVKFLVYRHFDFRRALNLSVEHPRHGRDGLPGFFGDARQEAGMLIKDALPFPLAKVFHVRYCWHLRKIA